MEYAIDIVGYIASILVFATFYVKKILTLRCIAMSSNVAFIFYGFQNNLYPIFILHSLLLPLNIYRIIQIKKTAQGFPQVNSEMKNLSKS